MSWPFDGALLRMRVKNCRLVHDAYYFQELIQNAEDAGASVSEFLFDENEFDRNRLCHAGLAQFQVG